MASGASPDVIRPISMDLFLNVLAIRMYSRRAEGLALKINLAITDAGDTFIVDLANAKTTNIAG